MAYPKGYTGVQIHRSTHQRLKNLKKDGESFDSVLNKLLDLEDKYTDKKEEYNYAYCTQNSSKAFKVVFSDKTSITYFNQVTNMYEKDIRAWQEVNPLSEEELDSFIRFIVKDSSILLLYDMEEKLTLNDITIERV